jgi:hypothetical protein
MICPKCALGNLKFDVVGGEVKEITCVRGCRFVAGGPIFKVLEGWLHSSIGHQQRERDLREQYATDLRDLYIDIYEATQHAFMEASILNARGEN